MEAKNGRPVMRSIREIAATGLLSEHALRMGVKQGWVPGVYVGNRFLVNEGRLIAFLNGQTGETDGRAEV